MPRPPRARPPFVAIGDNVFAGQTIGIIEAMKIMNEIAADRGGVVAGDPGRQMASPSSMVRHSSASSLGPGDRAVTGRLLPVGVFVYLLRETLESDPFYSDLWLEGEITDLSRSAPGTSTSPCATTTAA